MLISRNKVCDCACSAWRIPEFGIAHTMLRWYRNWWHISRNRDRILLGRCYCFISILISHCEPSKVFVRTSLWIWRWSFNWLLSMNVAMQRRRDKWGHFHRNKLQQSAIDIVIIIASTWECPRFMAIVSSTSQSEKIAQTIAPSQLTFVIVQTIVCPLNFTVRPLHWLSLLRQQIRDIHRNNCFVENWTSLLSSMSIAIVNAIAQDPADNGECWDFLCSARDGCCVVRLAAPEMSVV